MKPRLSVLMLLVVSTISARPSLGSEIFSDGFESGDLRAWSRSRNADCEALMNEVTNCDFDAEIGSWTLSSSATVYHVANDDSDGQTASGAVEMVAEAGGTSMENCFSRSLSSGSAFVSYWVDVKLLSGTQDSCDMYLGSYTSEGCSGSPTIQVFGIVRPAIDWQTRRVGGVAVDDVQGKSFRLVLSCAGEGAAVRFDDLVLTTLQAQ